MRPNPFLYMVLLVSSSNASLAVAEPPSSPMGSTKGEELVERSIGLEGLVASTVAAEELAEFCVLLVDSASWEQTGGKGKIKVGRRAITVTNTPENANLVRKVVVALSKLPALDEAAIAKPPKSPRIDVATISADDPGSPPSKAARSSDVGLGAAGQAPARIAFYSVGDIVCADSQSSPSFDELVNVVEQCTSAQNWSEYGGAGYLATFSPRGVIGVQNSGEVLAELDGLLAAIRRLPKLPGAGKSPLPPAAPTSLLGKGLGPDGKSDARLYHVADIVLAEGRFANYAPVMQRLMDHAAMESWQRNGGSGSMYRLVDRGGLVVVNTQQAHTEIEAELAKMRAEQAAATAKPDPVKPPPKGKLPGKPSPKTRPKPGM